MMLVSTSVASIVIAGTSSIEAAFVLAVGSWVGARDAGVTAVAQAANSREAESKVNSKYFFIITFFSSRYETIRL
jgi:hypothetical protein